MYTSKKKLLFLKFINKKYYYHYIRG